MSVHDATTATCHVLTFKEGVLSAIAHDLRIRVERFRIEYDTATATSTIVARFEADSLRVECAMKDGRPAHGTLRDGNKRDIEKNIVKDVLRARRYPSIEFRSTRVEHTGGQLHIQGMLRLHGAERPLTIVAHRDGARWSADVPLHQPDFGIKPYSAMLGTLKIQPTVRVKVTVPR